MNTTQTQLLEIVTKPTVCMLAPSFAIDYKFPEIVGMLKKLGFDKVTELTYGARIVNFWYADYIQKNPDQKYFITTPCPTCLALIKNRYPEIVQYLVPYVSPMAAMAKISKKYFPDHKCVFISPCLAKKNIEAPKFKDVIDLVVTFKELDELFKEKGISEREFSGQDFHFDSFYEEDTKIYPISGGLAKTAKLHTFFEDDKILITDEIKNLIPAFEDIKSGKSKYRFLDILNCPGGCIGGPALVNNKLTTKEKTERILAYQKQTAKDPVNTEDVSNNNEIDFGVSF